MAPVAFGRRDLGADQRPRRRIVQPAGKVVGNEAGNGPHRRSMGIVDPDHAADLGQSVKIREIGQRPVDMA